MYYNLLDFQILLRLDEILSAKTPLIIPLRILYLTGISNMIEVFWKGVHSTSRIHQDSDNFVFATYNELIVVPLFFE